MKKVLFLCTGNSARSIISECLLNQLRYIRLYKKKILCSVAK